MSTPSREFLTTELQDAFANLRRLEDRLLLAGAGGLLLSGSAAAYAIGFRAALKLGYAWLAPLPFVVTLGLLLVLWTQRHAARARAAGLRAAAGLPVPAEMPGAPLLRFLLWPLVFGFFALYAATLFVGMRAVYTASHAAGSLFGLVYLLLSAGLLAVALNTRRLARGQAAITPPDLWRALLPYPGTFLAGLGLFAAGWLAPFLTVGLNAEQLPVLNLLWRRNVDFLDSVPFAALLALAMLVFLTIEGLLVPAGRLWQARRTPANTDPAATPVEIGARLLAALALAYLLGGETLLVLAVLIALHQGVTALLISPRAPIRRGRFALLWGALLPGLRATAGALIWLGPAWTYTHQLLLFCFACFLALGVHAATQARGARIATVRGEEAPAFDVRSASLWSRAGFLAALFTAAGMTFLQALAEDCGFFDAILAAGYGRCNNGELFFAQAGLVNGLLLAFDLLALGILLCAAMVRLMRRFFLGLPVVLEEARPVPPMFFLAVAVALILAGYAVPQPSLAFGGLAAGALGLWLWHER